MYTLVLLTSSAALITTSAWLLPFWEHVVIPSPVRYLHKHTCQHKGIIKACSTSPPGRRVHSDTTSTLLGNIQPCWKYGTDYSCNSRRTNINNCL